MTKVTLLHHTPIEPLVVATALPYKSKQSRGLVKRVFDSGHQSIARHGMASFLVEGVSQSILRQISRHPHVSLTVLSTRYCDMRDTNIHAPETIHNNTPLYTEYMDDMYGAMDKYEKWVEYEEENGLKDVAKLTLPLATTTDLVMSANYQGWYDMLKLRNCTRTEKSFRDLSLEITSTLKGLIPEVFGELGCRGDDLGYCPETMDVCGKYPSKKEALKIIRDNS